jgi:hypothetical protein
MSCAPVLAGEGVEQDSVDVIADAEGEEPHVLRRDVGDVADDAAGVDLPFGGQTVGQEENHCRPPGLHHVEGGEQRQIDVSAAGRSETFDPIRGVLGFRRFDQIAGVFAGAGAELDDIEAVVRVEVLQNVEKRLSRLLDLLAFHAARGVQHHDDVFGDDLRLVVDPRCGEKQKIPLFRTLIDITHHAGADGPRRDTPEELEIGVRSHIARFVAGREMEVVWPIDGDVVRG